jgi:hypothetical protein
MICGKYEYVLGMVVTTLTRTAGNTSLCLLLASCLLSTPVAGQQSGSAASIEPLYTVLNPIGIAPAIERKPMAPRPESLDGKTVYLVDVTFNGGDLFLQEMQKWMAVNMPETKTVFRIKKGVYAADDPELWREIQAVNGLMIMAIGH